MLWGGWCGVALFSDGAWFFLRVVERGGFVNYDAARVQAIGLFQVPLVLALKAGVTDLQVLARIFSLTTLAVPAALYQLSLLRSRDDAVLTAATIAAIATVFAPACLFSVGEYGVAWAIAIAVMAFAARRGPPRALDGAVLLMLAVLSVRSYEIFLLLGPLLAALLALRVGASVGWDELFARRPGARLPAAMAAPLLCALLGLAGRFLLPAACLGVLLAALFVVRRSPGRAAQVAAMLHFAAASVFLAGAVVALESERSAPGLAPLLLGTLTNDAPGFWRNPVAGLTGLALLLMAGCALARPAALASRWPFVVASLPLVALALLPLAILSIGPANGWPDWPLISVQAPARLLCGGVAAVLVMAVALGRLDLPRRPKAFDIVETPGFQRRALAMALAMQVAVLPATLYGAGEWRALLGDLHAALRGRGGTIAFDTLPRAIVRFYQDENDAEFVGYLGRAVSRGPGDGAVEPPRPAAPIGPLPGYFWRE